MAGDNPPKQPTKHSERRKQTDRIAEIGHRIADVGTNISAAVRSLGNDILGLRDQIQTDSKTTDTREKEYYDRSIFWMKWGTKSSIVVSCLSLVVSGAALYVVNKQLNTMRLEQRAWISIEPPKTTKAGENKPLIAELIIKNNGKTPAKKLDSVFHVKIFKSNESPNLNLSGFAFSSTAGILNPNDTIPTPVPMLKGVTDILNPPLLTHDEAVEISSGKAYIVTFGKVTYFDIYGIPHWITYCSWQTTANVRGNYSSLDCVEYNNVDDN